LLEAPQLGMKM